MGNRRINRLLMHYQTVFNELYVIDTIVKMTKNSCMEQEFSGQYYGTSGHNSAKLSAERNNYINMLTLLAERVSNLMDLNISAENEVLLQENSDNSCREVAAECSAN